MQLDLFAETAEAPASAGPDDGAAGSREPAEPIAVPESAEEGEPASPVTLEAVTSIRPAIYAGRQRLWALSGNTAVQRIMRNAWWEARGLFSLRRAWRQRHQLSVARIPRLRASDLSRS
jgi:transposase InsO family protein